jgi:hypothetical protein
VTRQPLILLDLNPFLGGVTAGPAEDILDTGNRGAEAGAAMATHDFVHDVALGIFRQEASTPRSEQLRNTARVAGALVELGYQISAEARLLAAFSDLGDPVEPADQLTPATVPVDAARFFEQVMAGRAGPLAQVRRFLGATGEWALHQSPEAARPILQRLAAIADILTGLRPLSEEVTGDLARLSGAEEPLAGGHPAPRPRAPTSPPAAD